MRTAQRFLATAVVLGGVVLATGPVALAQECAYVPGDCVPGAQLPNTVDKPEPEPAPNAVLSTTDSRTLPFTGGEATVMALVGAGALAAGTVLVVAGRRRTSGAV